MPGRYATSVPPARWRTALGTALTVAFALVCLGLVPLVLVSSGHRGGDARAGSTGFVPEYGKAARGDAADRWFLVDRRLLEGVAERLNDSWQLPGTVRMTGRSCDGTDVAYDPELSRIDVCYAFVSEIREQFAEAGAGPATAERTVGVLTETLYHEAGHALIDALRLPYTGREEDVADQFAAYSLIPQGEAGRAAIRAAAESYELYAAAADPAEADFADEHAHDAARAVNYRSYLHGFLQGAPHGSGPRAPSSSGAGDGLDAEVLPAARA
ncbi:DUF4344 domain-containing metallopeptidase, partial [Streptomyces sparsus]